MNKKTYFEPLFFFLTKMLQTKLQRFVLSKVVPYSPL